MQACIRYAIACPLPVLEPIPRLVRFSLARLSVALCVMVRSHYKHYASFPSRKDNAVAHR